MTTGKTIALTRRTFVGKVMSLLFNMVGHSFSSKEQVSFNFMAVVTICSDLGAQENKVCHCFHFFPIYLPWSGLTRGFLVAFSSAQFSRSVMSDSLRPQGLQHARPPCLSPTLGVYSNSCPLSWWCHPTISSSVISFFSCLQSFPASGSFQMSQLFASDGQSIGVSASTSVLPMNTQDWSPLGWTGWISLQSKGLSRVFSNTIVQKHQFFSTQLSL